MLYDVLMNINPVAFRIGNLEVRWYGLIITCAMVLGLILLIFMAKKKGISSDDTLELFLWVIPLGIVFARVIYVFANNKEYGYFPIESWDDFVNCIAIWDGGITIYGGEPDKRGKSVKMTDAVPAANIAVGTFFVLI